MAANEGLADRLAEEVRLHPHADLPAGLHRGGAAEVLGDEGEAGLGERLGQRPLPRRGREQPPAQVGAPGLDRRRGEQAVELLQAVLRLRAEDAGIAVDREGHLYAVDAAFSNVQIFNKEARLLMFFGGSGDKPGSFLLPAKVVLDYDNLQYFQKYALPNFQIQYVILVTSQFGPRLVNVLAYGQERGKQYPTDTELLNQIEEKRKKELEEPQKP